MTAFGKYSKILQVQGEFSTDEIYIAPILSVHNPTFLWIHKHFRMSSATLWVDMYLTTSSTSAEQNALTLYAADIYGHEGGNINSVQISPPLSLIMSAHSMWWQWNKTDSRKIMGNEFSRFTTSNCTLYRRTQICGADCLSRFNGLRPELQTRRKAPWAL